MQIISSRYKGKLSARIVKGLVSGKKLITLELRTEI